jgi:hypothetical protein
MHSESQQTVESIPSISEAEKIFVAIRVRPLLQHEMEACQISTLEVSSSDSIMIRDDFDLESPSFRRRRSTQTTKAFRFDSVIGEEADQQFVFEQTALPIIDAILNGINACVFASGATGSGKTYTMIGDLDQPGIMMRSLAELFARLESSGEVNVKCSFVEIYNEIVRDLLIDCSENSTPLSSLEIREDPISGSTFIQGVTEITEIQNIDDMMTLLQIGNSRRTTEPTAANETSSRSHAILQVIVEQQSFEGETVRSKLSLVDLAGSERARDSENRGIRFVEGGNINKSLLALGNVIKAMTSPNKFIPYRDSKLTRLLKDSLGGNCRTVMIANVSPYILSYTDSLNTLKFANRAKNIKVRVRRNSFFSNPRDEIKKYVSVIRELEGVVDNLKRQLAKRNDTRSSCSSPPQEFQMFTDGSDYSDDDDSLGSDREEWLIKNQLMESVSEQLKIRNELSWIENQRVEDPISRFQLEERRKILIDQLRLNSDHSSLLHKSMSNLNNRRASLGRQATSREIDQLVNDCCKITSRITGVGSTMLQRQPSMLRNKSTLSLSSPTHSVDLPIEEKLKRLFADLVSIEKQRGTPLLPSFTPPLILNQSSSTPPLLRQPLSVRNEVRLSLQPNHSRTKSDSIERRHSSGKIYFN